MIQRPRRSTVFASLALAVCLVSVAPRFVSGARQVTGADERLSDSEFWRLTQDLSEPNGFFDSDNLVSNEDTFQTVIPSLARSIKPGRAYLGVGPDQNFAYIVATAPRVSFIIDIRRGNLDVQLMYKALIELSADRAEFLSRLFARRRPARLEPKASASDLFAAFAPVPVDRTFFAENLRAIVEQLKTHHGFPLADGDVTSMTSVYTTFVDNGPSIRFVSSRPGNWYPSYQDIQTSSDGAGVNRGYLAGESEFAKLKAAEERNTIVPIVGDFGGTHAIKAVGAYLKARAMTLGVFYTSNVEQYLFQNGVWNAFIANVRTLPIDQDSTFIRSCFNSCSSPGGSRAVTLLDSVPGLLQDEAAGKVRRYGDLLQHSRAR